MPELPEVETVMRGLEPAMMNKKISNVQKRRPDLRVPFPEDLEEVLEGRVVQSLTRRAKYILIHFDSEDVLVIHLGMSGRVLIISDVEYDPEKHDHLIITMNDGTHIVYNDPRRFGMIFLVSQDGMSSHKAFKDMGPEPLGNDFSAPILKERLKGKKVPIKQALLDQRVVCGLGNIYVCEALNMARILPLRKAHEVTLDEAETLVPIIRDVLSKAIAAGGSSLKDFAGADGDLGYFQHQFKTYDREGENCMNDGCSGSIERIKQGGRSTFYCPTCQK